MLEDKTRYGGYDGQGDGAMGNTAFPEKTTSEQRLENEDTDSWRSRHRGGGRRGTAGIFWNQRGG